MNSSDCHDNMVDTPHGVDSIEINFPTENPGDHMVPGRGLNGRDEARLLYFSGDKDAIPFTECWMQFTELSRSNDWSVEEQHADCLP